MVTSLFVSLLGFLYIAMTFKVIKGRRNQKISLGSGQDGEIIHLTSAHSNFASYAPFFLIALFLAEIQRFNIWFLMVIGFLFLTGRILHYKSMLDGGNNFKYRVNGMKLTIIPIMILLVLNLLIFITEFKEKI